MPMTVRELTHVGMQPGVALAMKMEGNSSVTAAGANQGNATVLTVELNVVTSSGASQGVVLPPTRNSFGAPNHVCAVRIFGANSVLVYPSPGEAINAGSVNGSVTVASGVGRIFYTLGDGVWFG